jgi:hypothetical protein
MKMAQKTPVLKQLLQRFQTLKKSFWFLRVYEMQTDL